MGTVTGEWNSSPPPHPSLKPHLPTMGTCFYRTDGSLVTNRSAAPVLMCPGPMYHSLHYVYPAPQDPCQVMPHYHNDPPPKRHQVKSACTNCAAACKRCSDSRPCPRCVKFDLSDSCVSIQRKERKKGVKRGPYKSKKKTTQGLPADDAPVVTSTEPEVEVEKASVQPTMAPTLTPYAPSYPVPVFQPYLDPRTQQWYQQGLEYFYVVGDVLQHDCQRLLNPTHSRALPPVFPYNLALSPFAIPPLQAHTQVSAVPAAQTYSPGPSIA